MLNQTILIYLFTHCFTLKILIDIFSTPVLIHHPILLQQGRILLNNVYRHKGFEEEKTR